MAGDKNAILSAIANIESRLKEIDSKRDHMIKDLSRLKRALTEIETSAKNPCNSASSLNIPFPLESKIALFRSLFRGREDVYPKLWISMKSGAKGYSPVCENEWVAGICRKPTVKVRRLQ